MKSRRFSATHHLPRYSKVLVEALSSPALIFFVSMGNFILVLCIVSFYHFESGVNPKVTQLFDVVWWGVSTVTTVGYGDIVPITSGGRITAIILMISGVSFFVGFSAILFSTFMDLEGRNLYKDEMKEVESINTRIMAKLEEISKRLDRLESKK